MTATSIDKIIDIKSTAVSGGGNGFNLAGMILDDNPILPFNTIKTFTSPEAVSDYFGASSEEYKYAQYYFATYTTNINTPAFIKYWYFVTDAIGAWVRGGKLNATTNLTALQAITSGSLAVKFGGITYTATAIDLSGDTSYSQMADTIETALQTHLVTLSVTWDSVTSAFTISNSVTGGSVDYPTSTPLSIAMKLLQADGAVLSQGSAALTPAQNMNNLKNIETNWFNFTTLFDIYSEEGYATAFALIAWLASQTLQFVYTFWSLEEVLTTSNPSGFSAELIANGYASIKLNSKGIPTVVPNVPISLQYGEQDLAQAIQGTGASIDYTALNGTISFNAKTFAGIVPLVDSDDKYDNLIANGFNFYTKFSARGNEFDFSELGTVGGDFLWLDNLYNDGWQNNAQVISLANLQAALPKLPANEIGEGFVNSELVGVALEAIRNGTIGIGNTFSNTVIARLKTLAGFDISNILTNSGYYIQTAVDRLNRTINYKYFYTASGAIVYINGSIIAVL